MTVFGMLFSSDPILSSCNNELPNFCDQLLQWQLVLQFLLDTCEWHKCHTSCGCCYVLQVWLFHTSSSQLFSEHLLQWVGLHTIDLECNSSEDANTVLYSFFWLGSCNGTSRKLPLDTALYLTVGRWSLLWQDFACVWVYLCWFWCLDPHCKPNIWLHQ